MKHEASMELYPTLDMIGNYFIEALLGFQLRYFCNNIIGIHEDDIPSHNSSGRSFLEYQKIKLDK